jgi:hypothetical protein
MHLRQTHPGHYFIAVAVALARDMARCSCNISPVMHVRAQKVWQTKAKNQNPNSNPSVNLRVLLVLVIFTLYTELPLYLFLGQLHPTTSLSSALEQNTGLVSGVMEDWKMQYKLLLPPRLHSAPRDWSPDLNNGNFGPAVGDHSSKARPGAAATQEI